MVGDIFAKDLKKSDTMSISSGDISVLACTISPATYITELGVAFFLI
jgi:hypothetical protein